MDELIHHCLRELAFDGDLGSDVSRLKDFIVDFYAHTNASHAQNPDDAFCSFVWGIVVQQPTVVVGLVPEDITSEVWIAPQTSAKRKAQARGEDTVEQHPPKLDAIPEPKTASFETLHHAYGSRLRLAVESDAIFAAITGSHIRSSKMSPMVYSALQIITRGRDAGVTVVDLGKQSGYDQKTCFYLVRQLTELELVVKVRRGGVGTHFCIHKYFFERSSSWKAIRDEEIQAEALQVKNQGSDDDFGEEDDDIEDPEALNFTPIDARHLSSLPLISARVIRLLKASKNHMHASNNMLITLGFSNPTKTDRRFFQSRIREMIQQRLIEKVILPSNRKSSVGTSVKCFRLVKQDPSTPVDTGLALSDPEDDVGDIAFEQNGVKLNITIHKQIIDHLEESGTSGMTLNELSASLCQFDKRTIELLLARADKSYPPSHLNDLRIASLMETSGRERRHRYFTAANFCRLVVQEELDKASSGYSDLDLKNVGGFLPVTPQLFYSAEEELINYSDTFKDADRRPKKPKKKKVLKNPILPNGKVKRGRPKKVVNDGAESSVSTNPRKNKRKREDEDETSLEMPEIPKETSAVTTVAEQTDGIVIKRGRGRPRKVPKKTPRTINAEPMTETQTVEDLPLESIVEPRQASVAEEVNTKDLSPSPEGEITGNKPPSVLSVETPTEKSQNAQLSASIKDSTQDFMGIQGIPSPTPNHIHDPVPEDIIPNPDALQMEVDDVSPPEPPNSSRQTAAIEPGVDVLLPTSQGTGNVSDSLTNTQAEASISAKVSTSSQASRINVSQLRRENELLRLVESAGGIVNIQTKEFYMSHMKLLETMAQAGEPTSAPVGTKTDKRTMTTTFSNLETRGRVKQLRTSVTTPTGLNRPACIIYLPHIEQSKINAFLADLAKVSSTPASHLHSFVKIDQKLDYGGETSSNSRGIAPLQLLQMDQPGIDEKERWSKNHSRAQQLFNQDEASTRDVLLAERTTMAQLFGFIVGKALRCREMHITIARAFEERIQSPNIVSHEKKIIDISFFCLDLPIQLYCSLVSPLSFDEELNSLLATPEGQKTLVRDLSPSLQTSLQTGRSRARSRVLDLLEILRSLNLTSPLQPSTSANPYITCQENGEHPKSFDVASLDGWTVNTPMVAPIYWQFHDNAPIHLYAKSETQAPFWKMVNISTVAEVKVYWDYLEKACLNTEIEPDVDYQGPAKVSTAGVATARSLRRAVSWKSDYLLTWHQMQYLKKFIDTTSMSTPLQIADDVERENLLKLISWTICAPPSSVEKYFSTEREKLLKSSERVKERARKNEKRTEEAKLSLAKKAEEARMQKEQEWSSLLARIHPEALVGPAAVRMERIRNQFLQSGSTKDVSKWEREIQSALHEADLANSKALKIHAKRPAPPKQAFLAPTVAHRSLGASIQSLIDSQGPPLQQLTEVEKKKRKRDSTSKPTDPNAPRKIIRRHRFHWNPEFDELARDASAIIRARCRNQSRLDWAAFEQVFPSVPRNTVRQRLSHIKETPGNEAYLRRLEDAWYDIWVKFRGTDALPDDDPDSPSNFDLVKHVEFLRSHVDKNAIRVGFAHATESAGVTLPADVQILEESFNVVQAEKTAPDWDFMWNALIEEGREKKLKKLVISRCPEEFPVVRSTEIDEVILAEATLKTVMGTPPERYDPALASSLLKGWGEEVIDTATRNLLSRGVLSKSQRDPTKQKPGRQLKISEVNQNAIGGSVPRDTFQDALSLLEEIDPTDTTWHDWPVTATDGDCATLIELVSEDKVDFNIDTSLPQAARPALDWNSKKADDDQIETAIAVRYRLDSPSQVVTLDDPQPMGSAAFSDSDHVESLEPLAVETGHGRDVENNPACCRKMTSRGCVNCAACLDEAWAVLSEALDQEGQETAKWILNLTINARESGIKKLDLSGDSNPRLGMIVKIMTEADVPLLYWMGYSVIALVSAHYVSKWSIAVSDAPLINVLPRRWLDIQGIRVADYWRSALRAVMGLVVFRPGITQAEIRWRLRAVYDRQEVNEVLRYLLKEGHLRLCVGFSSLWTSCGTGMPFDEGEERKVFWFVGEKHWYQV